MLTKKQKDKLDILELRYLTGTMKSSTFPIHLIQGWAKRYRASMEQRLMKQCKH